LITALAAAFAAKPALAVDPSVELTSVAPYQLVHQLIHGRQGPTLDTYLNGMRVLGAFPSGSADKWGAELHHYFNCPDHVTSVGYSERSPGRFDKNQRPGRPLVTHVKTSPNGVQWVRDEKSLSPSYIIDMANASQTPDLLNMYFKNPGFEPNREQQVFLNNIKRGTNGFRDRQYFQPGTVGLTVNHPEIFYSPQNISDNQTLSRLLMVDGGSHPILAVVPVGLGQTNYAQSYQDLLVFGYRTDSGTDLFGRTQDGQGEARLVLTGHLQIPANPDDNNAKFTRIENLSETGPNRFGDFNEYKIYVGGVNRETGEPNWSFALNNYPLGHPSASTETNIPWQQMIRTASNMDDKYAPRIWPQ
jgi:hypothetical protein